MRSPRRREWNERASARLFGQSVLHRLDFDVARQSPVGQDVSNPHAVWRALEVLAVYETQLGEHTHRALGVDSHRRGRLDRAMNELAELRPLHVATVHRVLREQVAE